MDCQAILARMPTADVPVRLFRLRPFVVGCLAVLLWITGILQLIMPGSLPDFVAPSLAVSVIVLVMPDLTRSLRAPLTLCVAALSGLMLHAGQTESVLAAVDFAAPFSAFLVSVAILRGNLLSARRLAETRARLAGHNPTGRRSVLLLLSCLLGGVFSIGGFPILAPLVEGCPPAETDRLAGAILCGNALALLWSPFTVGMGFAAAAVGIASGFAFLPQLLAAAAFGLVVALLVHGWPSLATLRQAGATAMPLLPPFALAIAATLAIATVWQLRVTDAVVLMAPPAGLIAYVGRAAGRPVHGFADRLRPGSFRAVLGAGAALRDLPMYVAGFALARALAESGLFGNLTTMLAESGAGPGIVLPPLALVMALAGLPALVSGGVVAAAANTLMPLSDPGARLVVTLFAWLATTLLSATGMSVLATASTFGTTVRRLVFGRNLAVAVLLAAVLATAIR
jgi:hypothetical protein